jgi:hypothetical protein
VLQQNINVDNTTELAAGVGFFGIQRLRRLINQRMNKEARVLHALEHSEVAVFTGIVEAAEVPLAVAAPGPDVEKTPLAA